MKTTYTIAAIAMFAVILGMGALSPAMAVKDKVDLCHYSAEKTIQVETEPGIFEDVTIPEHWKTINISQNGNAVNAHENNHVGPNAPDGLGEQYDFQITDVSEDTQAANEAECLRLMTLYPELEDKEEELV